MLPGTKILLAYFSNSLGGLPSRYRIVPMLLAVLTSALISFGGISSLKGPRITGVESLIFPRAR